MKNIVIALAFVLTLLLVIAWATSPVRPISWVPDHDPGLNVEFAANNTLFENTPSLKQIQVLQNVGHGPEDIIIGKDGYLYTGLADGRIVRAPVTDIIAAYTNQNAAKPDIQYEEYVNTQGRPLGLRFDAANNLIVADGVKGVLLIDTERKIRVLVNQFEGKKLLLVDHLDIAQDGKIWFSDASTKFELHNFIYDFLEASSTGRLFSYDPTTGITQMEMDKLFFANGVAVAENDEYVLINETGRAKIHRLWLTGDKAGSRDIFIDQLPAMPDNIFYKDGVFWVSLVALRDPLVETLAAYPLLRRIIGGLPKSLLKASSQYGFVIGMSPTGEVIYNLQSELGYQTITTATEHNGYLFLGSLNNNSIGVVQLPKQEQ